MKPNSWTQIFWSFVNYVRRTRPRDCLQALKDILSWECVKQDKKQRTGTQWDEEWEPNHTNGTQRPQVLSSSKGSKRRRTLQCMFAHGERLERALVGINRKFELSGFATDKDPLPLCKEAGLNKGKSVSQIRSKVLKSTQRRPGQRLQLKQCQRYDVRPYT